MGKAAAETSDSVRSSHVSGDCRDAIVVRDVAECYRHSHGPSYSLPFCSTMVSGLSCKAMSLGLFYNITALGS